jgi:hypothetical protein
MTYCRSIDEFACSLLCRYFLLYSQGQVALEKVAFSGVISAGLRATSRILTGTYLLTTCSSMAEDLSQGGGFSVIESREYQLGPVGPRVLLGPLRFANHDCEQPTCQVGTHLCRTNYSQLLTYSILNKVSTNSRHSCMCVDVHHRHSSR